MTENHQFDTFSWKQLTLESDPEPGQLQQPSNSLHDLLNEFKEGKPDPVEAPEPEPGTDTPETGAKTAPNSPNLTPSSSSDVRASAGQIAGARLILKGFDSLFAGAGVAITGRSEKYDYYKATSRDVNELADLLAETFAAYDINPAPYIPFALGFVGVYGAKSMAIFNDKKEGKQTTDQLKDEAETLRLKEEIAALKSNRAKVQTATVKTGKRGRPRKA